MYHPEQLHVIHLSLLPSLSYPLISLFHPSFLPPLCFLPHLCFLLPLLPPFLPALFFLTYISSLSTLPFPSSPSFVFPPSTCPTSSLLHQYISTTSSSTSSLPHSIHVHVSPPLFLSSPFFLTFAPSFSSFSSTPPLHLCSLHHCAPHLPSSLHTSPLPSLLHPPSPPSLLISPPPLPSLTPHLPSPSFPCSTFSLPPSHLLGYLPFFTLSSSSFNHPLPPYSSPPPLIPHLSPSPLTPHLPPLLLISPPHHFPFPSISPPDSKEKELGTNTSLLTTLKFSYIAALSIHAILCCWFAISCKNKAMFDEDSSESLSKTDSWVAGLEGEDSN